MIPETASNYSPWLRDLQVGTVVKIATEFKTPESAKIQSFLLADVTAEDGNNYTLGINKSTYYALSKVFGQDTVEWIGKDIKYMGKVKLNKGTGHFWEAV